MSTFNVSFTELEELTNIRADIKRFLDNQLDPNAALFMNLAINEAINNSLIHGKSTFITLELISSVKNLVATIEGNGYPFDGNGQIQCIRESSVDLFKEQLYRESNRGLLILEEVCDDVIYTAGKNKVLLVRIK